MQDTLYNYKARVVDVYDADTVTLCIDCGFGITMPKEKVRLYGIDAKEVRGDEKQLGLVARDALRHKIMDKDLILQSVKDKKGKYGRKLGTLFLNDEGEWININSWLVENGFAIEKFY